jgi:hypothetical protein
MTGRIGTSRHKIIEGLKDAIAYAKGDKTRGRETIIRVCEALDAVCPHQDRCGQTYCVKRDPNA